MTNLLLTGFITLTTGILGVVVGAFLSGYLSTRSQRELLGSILATYKNYEITRFLIPEYKNLDALITQYWHSNAADGDLQLAQEIEQLHYRLQTISGEQLGSAEIVKEIKKLYRLATGEKFREADRIADPERAKNASATISAILSMLMGNLNKN